MQCKDIQDSPILTFLHESSVWCTWYGDEYENSVTLAMPKNTPQKLVLAKMKGLLRRDLVSGCACGCRGDFEITIKGKNYLIGDL